jgi:phage/conjugal plasmid C-4 type zinc finger TraR family protein
MPSSNVTDGQPDFERGYRTMRGIRRQLETTRVSLSQAIESGKGVSRERDERREVFKDPYGAATLSHDDEVLTAVLERRARDLQQVTRALEDLDAGRYGTCQECGGGIPEARLRVVPFATRCVRCQAEREVKERSA